MKRLAAVVICLVLIAVSLTGCTDKAWERTDEYEDGEVVIVSSEGVRYHGTTVWHIVGFKTDKKLGIIPDPYGGKKDQRVCSIVGADNDMYIAVQARNERLWDKGPGYYVYIRSGEEVDYINTDISEVVFMPMNELTDDYSQYIENHGLFGDEAKAAMEGIYDNEGMFAFNEFVGNIVYRQEGMDWCYFMAFVRYSYEEGFWVQMNGKYYLLSDNTVNALNITLNDNLS